MVLLYPLLDDDTFLTLCAGRLGRLMPRGGGIGSRSSDFALPTGTVLPSSSRGVEMQWNSSIKDVWTGAIRYLL